MQLTATTLPRLAEDLLAHRRMLGLSREEVGKLTGLSLSFIRDAEQTPGRCTLERLLKLAQVLGVSLRFGAEAPPAMPG